MPRVTQIEKWNLIETLLQGIGSDWGSGHGALGEVVAGSGYFDKGWGAGMFCA